MCNIAGYVGSERAAPILIDMMLKQEGFGGGYYSGIATLHQGKIHYAKLTGDVKRLVELTNAASLPGNTGIIHSRSKSGGGDEWAHPFIGTGGSVAYVANGAPGFFGALDSSEQRRAIFERIIDGGYDFPSKVDEKIGRYPTLPNGCCAHMSDVMSQLITMHIDEGMSGADAMEAAFCELPSEIVGLILNASEERSITVARINQPMNVGFAEDGTFLSTAALAFPERVKRILTLPHNAKSVVTKDGYQSSPFKNPPSDVAEITPEVSASGYNAVLDALSEGKPLSVGGIANVLKPLFVDGIPNQSAHLAYEIMRCLYSQNKLETVKTTVSGSAEGILAPNFKVTLS